MIKTGDFYSGAVSSVGNNTLAKDNAGWNNDEWDFVQSVALYEGQPILKVNKVTTNNDDTITVMWNWNAVTPGLPVYNPPTAVSEFQLIKIDTWVKLEDIENDNKTGPGDINITWDLEEPE